MVKSGKFLVIFLVSSNGTISSKTRVLGSIYLDLLYLISLSGIVGNTMLGSMNFPIPLSAVAPSSP